MLFRIQIIDHQTNCHPNKEPHPTYGWNLYHQIQATHGAYNGDNGEFFKEA